MDPIQTFHHLFHLLLPGVSTGLMAAWLTKLLWRRELGAVRLRRLAGFAVAACTTASLAGLLLLGQDGRMLTYLGMVAACALALVWGGWGRRRSAG